MIAPFPPVVFFIFGGGLHIQKPVFAAVQHIRAPYRGKMRHLISQISGDAKGRADAQEEGLEVSPSFTGEGGNVSIQAVAGGQNQSAKIPRSSRRRDGVCERDKHTEHPWSASRTAPSVAVTWGFGSHGLLTDLGSNTVPTLMKTARRWARCFI